MPTKQHSPLVVAHRGYSSIAPENTCRAIIDAVEHGVDVVEIDVQFSKDKEIMVIHDVSVDRTTDCSGPVKSFTREELQNMDAGSFKGGAFAGIQIPTLEEVLQLWLDNDWNAKLLIEIKFQIVSWEGLLTPYKDLVEGVVALVQKKKLQSKMIIQSFLEETLLKVRKLDKRIETHLLVLPWRSISNIIHLDVDAFNPQIYAVTTDFIEEAHRKGKKVFVWTVDSTDHMEFCIKAGCDGVITNKPVKLRKRIDRLEKDGNGGVLVENPSGGVGSFAGVNMNALPCLPILLRSITGRA